MAKNVAKGRKSRLNCTVTFNSHPTPTSVSTVLVFFNHPCNRRPRIAWRWLQWFTIGSRTQFLEFKNTIFVSTTFTFTHTRELINLNFAKKGFFSFLHLIYGVPWIREFISILKGVECVTITKLTLNLWNENVKTINTFSVHQQ